MSHQNLSLLARGVGARTHTKSGNDRLEIIFEPQDWLTVGGRAVPRPPPAAPLPPIPPHDRAPETDPQETDRQAPHDSRNVPITSQSWDVAELHPKKTFITRKGALLMFAQDFAAAADNLAEDSNPPPPPGKKQAKRRRMEQRSNEEEEELKTCGDLYRSILTFGGETEEEEAAAEVNLRIKPVSHRRGRDERQMRPGFSAKRYVSTFSFTWDPATLDRLRQEGKLTDKTLFGSVSEPTAYKRLHFDMSQPPIKYQLRGNLLADRRPHRFTFTWTPTDGKRRKGPEDAEAPPNIAHLEDEAITERTEPDDRWQPEATLPAAATAERDQSRASGSVGPPHESPEPPPISAKRLSEDGQPAEDVHYDSMEFEEKVELIADLLVQTAEEADKPRSVSEQLLSAATTAEQEVGEFSRGDTNLRSIESTSPPLFDLCQKTEFDQAMEAVLDHATEQLLDLEGGGGQDAQGELQLDEAPAEVSEAPESDRGSSLAADDSHHALKRPTEAQEEQPPPATSESQRRGPVIGEGLDQPPPTSRDSQRSLKGSKLKAVIAASPDEQPSSAPRLHASREGVLVVSGSKPPSREREDDTETTAAAAAALEHVQLANDTAAAAAAAPESAATRTSSGRSSVTKLSAFPVLPPIGAETDLERSDQFQLLQHAVASSQEKQEGVAASQASGEVPSSDKSSKGRGRARRRRAAREAEQPSAAAAAASKVTSATSTAASVEEDEEAGWGGATVDETQMLATLVEQEKAVEEERRRAKLQQAKDKEQAERQKREQQRLQKEAAQSAEQERRDAEHAELEAERRAREQAAIAEIERRRKKVSTTKAPAVADGPVVGNKTVDMFGGLAAVPEKQENSSKQRKVSKTKKPTQAQQLAKKKKEVFKDVAGEKGAFVVFEGEILNVGHELEMKERLIENMKLLFSSLLASNLTKKLRGKRGLYRRATLVAAAVLSQLFAGSDFGLDARVAARLWGTKLADMMGDDGEMEYYIDPETGEMRQRRKRRPIPKLEVFVDADGKMYVMTETGERIEVFKDPSTGKLMFRTKSGKVHEVPGALDLLTDPITGKMYLGEKRDPGMEVFTDPVTGKMFIKTKDGKVMEVFVDPTTGKTYMRTASGTLKELPPGMELYVDPATGKMFLGSKPTEPTMEIFTDPITGKRYIKTEDGELLEIVVGDDGNTYLRTKSGKLRALPEHMQVVVDPVTGRMYIGSKAEHMADGGGDQFKIFTDDQGRQFIRTKDGEILELFTDPATGKTFLKTKSGRLRELPADMELVVDPTTGKRYLKQTKDPGLQMFTDPLTGKTYIRTKDGEVLEVVVGEDGKTYLKTKSGTLKELGDHLEVYVDPVTGKMFIGERRNPGMEVFTDPDTGITYVRTADGQVLEMWTDPESGKTYLRTKSGRIVSEVDDTLVMYTDPKTGKKYLAPRHGAQQSSMFTDPTTGKTYVRTRSGRIVEAKLEAPMEIYVDPVTGKTYLRTQSGTLKEMPADGEIIKDASGKVFMKTRSGRLIELAGDVDVFIDPVTGKAFVVSKGADGDVQVLTDPATGKMFLRTACGQMQELVADGSVFTDPSTGRNYVRTKSGRLHELSDECEIFIDPETGKLFMRTKSGNILEMGDDVTMFTDPRTGRTYVRTVSGRFLEMDEDCEIEIDPVTGKMFMRTKSGNLKELACEMETVIDPVTGKKIVRPKGGVGFGFELYVDPETGKTYLRQRDDLLDEIDLEKLSPAERRRVEVLRKRRQRELEKRMVEQEAQAAREAQVRAELDKQIMHDKIREAEDEKRKIEEEARRRAEEHQRQDKMADTLAALRAAEEEQRRRAEEESLEAQERLERHKAEQLRREAAMWEQSLKLESELLGRNQHISRAFVYSYFELLRMMDQLQEED